MISPPINLAAALVSEASKYSGIKESRIYGSCRTPVTVSVRWSIWLVLRRAGWSNDEIAASFGRDRTTVQKGLAKAFFRNIRNDLYPGLVATLELSLK